MYILCQILEFQIWLISKMSNLYPQNTDLVPSGENGNEGSNIYKFFILFN